MNEILVGKVKTVYDVDGEADKVTIKFHDKVTAGNGRLVDFPEEKGKVCCLISALLFEMLEKRGVSELIILALKDLTPYYVRSLLSYQ